MKKRRRALALLLVVAAVCAGLLIRRYGVGTVRVAGVSMRDTLQSGDIALVTRFDYLRAEPHRGDVVECRFPGREDTYVKRIVALPGDCVAFVGGGLTVNGERVEEPYAAGVTEDYAIVLGDDEYLALGDNRGESYDSRMDDMGPISSEDILGRVRWVLYPLDRFGPIR